MSKSHKTRLWVKDLKQIVFGEIDRYLKLGIMCLICTYIIVGLIVNISFSFGLRECMHPFTILT